MSHCPAEKTVHVWPPPTPMCRLTDRRLARGHACRFPLHLRHDPHKVFVRKQLLDDAVRKHGRCDGALRAVGCYRRELLPHIGRGINAGGGPETRRRAWDRLHGRLALHPAPGKGRGCVWGEDEAGDTLTRNDIGVPWLLVGEPFFAEKVAWSKHGEGGEAPIQRFPDHVRLP